MKVVGSRVTAAWHQLRLSRCLLHSQGATPCPDLAQPVSAQLGQQPGRTGSTARYISLEHAVTPPLTTRRTDRATAERLVRSLGAVCYRLTDLPEHIAGLMAQPRGFAQRSGLALTDIYTERPDMPSRDKAVLCALVDAPRRPYVRAVVIPSPEHFFVRRYVQACAP